MKCLPTNAVIERLEGEPVSDCNSPIGDRDYPDKSLKNSISAKNRNKRMERIREKLYGRGYEIPKNKGREFVLQIGAPFICDLTDY